MTFAFFKKKKTQIESWISTVSASDSSLISKEVIGSTYEGRTMTLLKVGRQHLPSPTPEIKKKRKKK